MKCEEFQLRCAANPDTDDSDYLEHMHTCGHCANYAAQMKAFDNDLAAAFRIDVPEDLADCILERHQSASKKPAIFGYPLYALAASLLLAMGITMYVLLQPGMLVLDKAVIAHIENELPHLVQQDNVQFAELNGIMNKIGGTLNSSLGKVNYAGTCHIRKKDAGHIVIPGETGPVTILIMPGETISKRQLIHTDQFKGVIVPSSKGSVAIIGEKNEPLDKIEDKIKNLINWI